MSDWQVLDSDGAPYYYNSVTGETSWSAPEDFNLSFTQENSIVAEKYSVLYTAEGVPYYVNNESQETFWDAPSDFVSPVHEETVVETSPPVSEWVESVTEDNSVYYYNTITGETSWEKPVDFVDSHQYDYEAPDTVQTTDYSMWQTLIDPQSGQTYYMNTITNETTWDSPFPVTSAEIATPTVTIDTSHNATNMSLFDSNKLNLPALNTPTRGGRYSTAPTDFDDGSDETNTSAATTHQNTTSRGGRQVTFHDESYGESKRGGGLFGIDEDEEDDVSEEQQAKYAEAYVILDAIDSVNNTFITATTSTTASPAGTSGNNSVSNAANNAMSIRNETVQSALKVSEILLSVDPHLYSAMPVLRYAGDKLFQTYTMERYVEQFFVFERPRGGAAALGLANIVERLLTHQTDVLKSSLTSLAPNMQSDAVTCSRLIHSFAGDRKSHRPHFDLASSLLLRMLAAVNTDLHDECYCQLIKHTHRNPSTESSELGWQLLLICLISFPPSQRLLPFLFNYLSTSLATVPENAQKFVYLSLKLCLKSARVSTPRKEIPTQQEIQAALLGEMTEIFVYTLDRHRFAFTVDSFTTVSELDLKVKETFHILPENRRMFALFEVTIRSDDDTINNAHHNNHENNSRDEERVLLPSDRLLDLTASWDKTSSASNVDSTVGSNSSRGGSSPSLTGYSSDKEQQQQLTTHSSHAALLSSSSAIVSGSLPKSRLLFKVRHYFPMLEADYYRDLKATQLLYDQAVHHILHAYYPYTLQDAVLLAALQLQTSIGAYVPGREVPEARGKSLSTIIAKQFLPSDVNDATARGSGGGGGAHSSSNSGTNASNINNSQRSDVESRVLSQYKLFANVSKLEAQIMYLTFVSSWKLYGCSLFVVKWHAGGSNANNTMSTATMSSSQPPPLTTAVENGVGEKQQITTEVVLAVGPRGILLVDITPSVVTSYPFLAEYGYAEIATWGHSFDSLVLVTTSISGSGGATSTATGSAGVAGVVGHSSTASLHSSGQVRTSSVNGPTHSQTNKTYFHTSQGKVIDDLLRTYKQSEIGLVNIANSSSGTARLSSTL